MAAAITTVKRAVEGLNSHPLRPHVKPTIHRAIFRYRLRTAGQRLLPDFIIIGAPRCGTTSLYRYLTSHPWVGPAMRKEVHFFDEQRNFEKGTPWYRAHFPLRLSLLRNRGLGRGLLTGESTPYYMYHPDVPERVARTLPDTKLIVLLRNPVDRAYSNYRFKVMTGPFQQMSFEDVLNRELPKLQTGASFIEEYYNCLCKGIYANQLSVWMSLFPRDQFLVLKSEDFYADPTQALGQVEEFLGVPEWVPGTFRKFNDGGKAEMDPSTRKWVADFFRPYNERLYDLLGRDLGWDFA